MQKKAMGDSGLVCSALGFGTWELSTTQYGAIDMAEASNAVAMAIDHGIMLFDTAEVYGPYHSEELLGKALGNRRPDDEGRPRGIRCRRFHGRSRHQRGWLEGDAVLKLISWQNKIVTDAAR